MNDSKDDFDEVTCSGREKGQFGKVESGLKSGKTSGLTREMFRWCAEVNRDIVPQSPAVWRTQRYLRKRAALVASGVLLATTGIAYAFRSDRVELARLKAQVVEMRGQLDNQQKWKAAQRQVNDQLHEADARLLNILETMNKAQQSKAAAPHGTYCHVVRPGWQQCTNGQTTWDQNY